MMRPSDSNSQVRADHYSAMGHGGGGGGGGDDVRDAFNKTHTVMGAGNESYSPGLVAGGIDDISLEKI